jgi:hypothetical protein
MNGESFRFRESMGKKGGVICDGSLLGGQQPGADNASLGRKKHLEL